MSKKSSLIRLTLVASLVTILAANGCAPRMTGLWTRSEKNQDDPKLLNAESQSIETPVFDPNANQKYKWIDYSEWRTGHPIAESAVIVLTGTAVGAAYAGLVVLYIFAPGQRGSFPCISAPPPKMDPALFPRQP
jgi:hypothetical protein